MRSACSHQQIGIQVDGLHHRAGRRTILRDISFQASPGILALLGANGAGKTTLLRILATATPSFTGEVRVLGRDLSNPKDVAYFRQHLGYVPQNLSYYPHFTVSDFVRYVALLKKMERQRIPDAVNQALARVRLADRATAKLSSLSGGMLRRAAIAQAIVNDPQVVIMDEPTAGLDPEQRVAFRELIQDIQRNRIVVISTHLIEDVIALADQVLVLNNGSVVFAGSIRNLTPSSDSPPDDSAVLEAKIVRLMRQGSLA